MYVIYVHSSMSNSSVRRSTTGPVQLSQLSQVVAISRLESKKAFAEKCCAMAFLASSDAAQRLGRDVGSPGAMGGAREAMEATWWGDHGGWG